MTTACSRSSATSVSNGEAGVIAGGCRSVPAGARRPLAYWLYVWGRRVPAGAFRRRRMASAFPFGAPGPHARSSVVDVDSVAEVQPVEDGDGVRDRHAHAAVAGRIRRHGRVAVDGVAADEVA